jgi:hypothetical protein
MKQAPDRKKLRREYLRRKRLALMRLTFPTSRLSPPIPYLPRKSSFGRRKSHQFSRVSCY